MYLLHLIALSLEAVRGGQGKSIASRADTLRRSRGEPGETPQQWIVEPARHVRACQLVISGDISVRVRSIDQTCIIDSRNCDRNLDRTYRSQRGFVTVYITDRSSPIRRAIIYCEAVAKILNQTIHYRQTMSPRLPGLHVQWRSATLPAFVIPIRRRVGSRASGRPSGGEPTDWDWTGAILISLRNRPSNLVGLV